MPGEITSALSAGTNALLRLGATPLTSPDDVLEALGIEPRPPRRPRARRDAARACSRRSRDEPSGVDELVRETGLDAAAVATALAELELAGRGCRGRGLYRGVRPQG